MEGVLHDAVGLDDLSLDVDVGVGLGAVALDAEEFGVFGAFADPEFGPGDENGFGGDDEPSGDGDGDKGGGDDPAFLLEEDFQEESGVHRGTPRRARRTQGTGLRHSAAMVPRKGVSGSSRRASMAWRTCSALERPARTRRRTLSAALTREGVSGRRRSAGAGRI